MTAINKFLAHIFSEGIVRKPLSELAKLCRGRVISKEYLCENAGVYPVYSSQTLGNGILGCIDSYDFDCESVTWTTDGANAGSVFYHKDEKFSITNVCGLIQITDKNLNCKYLYYFLQTEAAKHVNIGMGNAKLMNRNMAKIQIPLPSLKAQEEIVEILDTFTNFTQSLEEEIVARKQQFEYYRDTLLGFKM